MPDANYTVTVTRDLEDLIPGFMRNRRKEVDSLRAALESADYEQLRQLGHRMKGVGNSYGFPLVSSIGAKIENQARSGERGSLDVLVAEYADYLDKVTIVFG